MGPYRANSMMVSMVTIMMGTVDLVLVPLTNNGERIVS